MNATWVIKWRDDAQYLSGIIPRAGTPLGFYYNWGPRALAMRFESRKAALAVIAKTSWGADRTALIIKLTRRK